MSAWIGDAKPINEKRNHAPCPEMSKAELPYPTTGANHKWPAFVTSAISIYRSDEIEHMSSTIKTLEPHKRQSGRVQILWPAVQTCEANNICRTLYQRNETPFGGFSLPAL
jgi:hypothetical protein